MRKFFESRPLERRIARLERVIPAIGRTISALDTVINAIGNTAPEQSPFLRIASENLEEAKRVLMEYASR